MRSWLWTFGLMMLLAAPAALAQTDDENGDDQKEEAPEVRGQAPPIDIKVNVEVHNDSHSENNDNDDNTNSNIDNNNDNGNNSEDVTQTTGNNESDGSVRERQSVFDEDAAPRDTDSREVDIKVRAPERPAREEVDREPERRRELADPVDRKSVFDEPAPKRSTSSSSASASRPSTPPPSNYNPEPVILKREARVWPLTLGFKLGAMTGEAFDTADDDLASYTLWVGYRHRPFRDPVGPFVSAGLEFSSMRAPYEYERIGVIAPTVRAGFDWVPYSSPIPVTSMYVIAGYVAGPGFDHGTRLGAGFSLLPLIVCGAPTTLELTNENYVRDDEVINTLHVQIGWMF